MKTDQELLESIKDLSLEDKIELCQQLLGGYATGLTVMSTSEVCSNLSHWFPKILQNASPELLSSLMIMIGERIASLSKK